MLKKILVFLIYFLPLYTTAQNNTDSTERDTTLTLTQCLQYALKHQPALKQSYIDERIADANNRIAYSAWLPQVTGLATYTHYFQLPTVFFPSTATAPGSPPAGTLVASHTGLYNTSIPELAANQVIFSPDVLVAVRTGHLNTLYAKQTTTGTKIQLISDVSKSFIRPAAVAATNKCIEGRHIAAYKKPERYLPPICERSER